MIAEFASRLSEGVRADFLRVMEVAGSALPMDALFADLGSSPSQVTGNTTSDESLHQALRAAVKRLKDGGVSWEEIKEMSLSKQV